MKNIMLTDVIRPRSSSGVRSCRTVCRMTALTVSAAPEAASAKSDNGNQLETPKTAMATP